MGSIVTFCFLVLTVLVQINRSDADEKQVVKILNIARSLYFEELGCKEKTGESGFDCPNFNETLSGDKCYFNGREYNKGDQLETDETVDMCVAACFCQT